MALVILPGLNNLIEDISEEKKLPPNIVEAALREALLKGYEKYRRTFYIGVNEDPFDEEYFNNFDVGLDLDEEGYRILASKIIVEEVESEDHQISLLEVKQVADDAQVGDTVVLDVTPEKEDFGRMAASTTKQVLAQKLRDQQRKMIQEEFADLEDPVLTARVIRFERQSIIMGVSSGIGRPEVEAELPKRDQLPNDNYRANATFKVFLKEVSEIARKGPQLFVSRANAGLVVYLFENEVPEIQEGTVKIVEEVESEDHQISLAEVKQVAEDAQIGDTVVLDVTPEKEDFGRMAASTTKQVLAQKLRDQQRKMIQEEFADLEDPVLTARVIRFERQSVIMGVSSGIGRPEVEAELPKRDQLPNDNYRANATFKVFLKEVS